MVGSSNGGTTSSRRNPRRSITSKIPSYRKTRGGSNWKDRRMLARYAHLGDENLRDAEGKITTILQSGSLQCMTPAEQKRQTKK